MTYEELGQKLRSEREKRLFTIYDAANELKINPRQIQALEDGNLDVLPHKAYVKGFARSYAQWLGMGREEINELLTPFGSPDGKNVFLSSDHIGSAKKSKKRYFFLFFMLFLGGVIFLGWKYDAARFIKDFNFAGSKVVPVLQTADKFIESKDTSRQDSIPSSEISGQFRDKEAAGNNEGMTGQRAEISQAKIQESKSDSSLNETFKTETSAPHTSPRLSEGAASANPASSINQNEDTVPGGEETNVNGQNKLIITATEECWVHSNADKSDTRQFSLRKGDTFALTFAKSLELKLGNAGGVRLRYNGQDLPAAGQSGQVKVLKFPPSDL